MTYFSTNSFRLFLKQTKVIASELERHIFILPVTVTRDRFRSGYKWYSNDRVFRSGSELESVICEQCLYSTM